MNNLQYQMLAYNLLSQQQQQQQQQQMSNNHGNSSTPTAIKPEPMNIDTQPPTESVQQQPQSQPPQQAVAEPEPVEVKPVVKEIVETPKTMAERLVEAVYQQSVDYITLRNNNAALPPFTNNNKPQQTSDKVTALELLSGQQRSHAHASRQQRLLLPDTAPKGLDPYTILQEREKRIEQRVEIRLSELEATMDEQDQRQPLGYLLNEYYEDTVKTASPQRLATIVQLKSLQLRKKQTKVREEIVKNMEEANRLASSVDRTAYRKIMKQTLREAKLTEKLERQQRIDREKKEKQRHLDYLQTVCNQGRDLITWHKAHQAKMGKLGKAILQFHAHIEKEEQRRSDKRSKDRIRALRNDDEEAYLKLIDEAKDTRLTLLLKQTGTYLESLTKAVVDQQTENMNFQNEEEEEDQEPVDEEMILTDSHGNKVDYYRMAHRIQENVSQPSIMVGGKLKEYQVSQEKKSIFR